MNRCKTCIHWKDPYVIMDGLPMWGNCSRLEENDRLEGSVPDENAASEYVSREDFGCVLHEEK